jgi:tetratricopeptide (TPR) repeat protein
MAGEMDTQDKTLRATLDALEVEVDARVSSQAVAPRLRELLASLAQDSADRPRAHRLMGVVMNRLKLDREALTELRAAKAKAEALSPPGYAELAKIGRETAVVYAWRGDDRSAALELLPALAYACLAGDAGESARIIAEYGRIELEARRFGNVAMLLRLFAGKTHGLELPPRETQRMKINLCQALNRIGAHAEVLKWAGELHDELDPQATRLKFLTVLEEVRALAALKRFEDAERALKQAEALLPEGEEAFERAEFLQLRAELAELEGGEQALEHLERLIADYAEQRLVVREAMARRTLANTLFKLGRAGEAREALSRGLRAALDANLIELADEIRADMLKSAGAEYLEELAEAIDLAGGGHAVERRFVRVGRLGKGGSGEVWRAIDLRDGCEVALKKLDLRGFGEDRRRAIVNTIKTEYAAAGRLDDPRFARVLDLAMVPGGPVYIVQRYIEGPTLRELYASGRAPAHLLELLAQIADALSHLHAKQVVHRDLKPENVIVARDEAGGEKAVLIDLGIALLAGQADGHARFGTAPYVAPEQLEGGRIDGRADIYALGQMVAEIWGGHVPSRFTLGMLRRADEPTLMPREIRELVRGMLRDDPERRTSDLRQIAEALRAQHRLMSETLPTHTP